MLYFVIHWEEVVSLILILQHITLTLWLFKFTWFDHNKFFLATISKSYIKFMVTWQPRNWPCTKINNAQKALKKPMHCTLSGEKLIKKFKNIWNFKISWEPYRRPCKLMMPCDTIEARVKKEKKLKTVKLTSSAYNKPLKMKLNSFDFLIPRKPSPRP